MEEEKVVEVEKGQNWIQRNPGWTFLIALCFLTGVGIVSQYSFELYRNYWYAVLAAYANGFVMILWGIALYYFVMIGNKILTNILLVLMVVVVWGGIGAGIYLIFESVFWSIFGLPVAFFCIIVLFSIISASCDSSSYDSENRPWEY